MKKRKILGILSAAAMMFGISMPVSAVEEPENPLIKDITAGNVIIRASDCVSGCPGHKIQGGSSSSVIKVIGGTHTIILDDINIDASRNSEGDRCALDIDPSEKADVTLILKGKNTLKSGIGNAGIRIKGESTLRIGESDATPEGQHGELDVTGGSSAAGIGGDMRAGDGGNITIDSGVIRAQGGKDGAGIGGSNTGSAGNITINGGKVTAAGGTNESGNGAPGIGCGANAKQTGSVAINGGDVTAEGGKGKPKWDEAMQENKDVIASGISCEKLSSKIQAESPPVIITSSIDVKDTKAFNGIAWVDENNCQVYGYVDLKGNTGNFTVGKGKKMTIRDGSSLVVPKEWRFAGTITGKGTLIGANEVDPSGGGTIDGVKEHATLTSANISVEKEMTYNGKDLQKDIIEVDTKSGNFPIDTTNWKVKIVKEGSGTGLPESEIKNVGMYTITYFNESTGVTIEPSKNDSNNKCKVIPRNISEARPDNLDPQNYNNGQEIVPPFELEYNTIKLIAGTDYINTGDSPKYIDNKERGTAKIIVDGIGNFTGTKEIKFEIVAAPLDSEGMTSSVTLADATYDGNPKTPSISVQRNGVPLTPETDYSVSYKPTDLTNAGKVTVTITGKNNYSGTQVKEIEILPRTLNLLSAEAEGRDYNGETSVDIKRVDLDSTNVLEADKANVRPKGGLTANVDSPNAGTYTEVTFADVALEGTKAQNYKVELENGGKVPLRTASGEAGSVTINKAECKEKPDIKASYEISKTNPTNKFVCTLSPEKAEYEYSMDSNAENANWQKGVAIFDGIDPGTKHTFYARVAETENYLAGEAAEVKVDFKLLERAKPKNFKLTFTLNEDGKGFTATIPPVNDPDAVYSFDGENYSGVNTKIDCQPGTEYTGYVKYMANTLYDESEAVSDTQTSPKLIVETPVIDPNGGKFLTTQKVTISCETDDAKIYYTTDGKNPTTESTEYKEPFELKSSATVKAIAVKKGMDDSTMASATFVQGNSVETKLDIQPNIKPENITPGLAATEFNTPEAIQTKFSSVLTAMEGYNYLNIAYYDITLWLSPDGEKWEQATVDNFPKEGLLVTLPYPIGTSKDTHDFVVSHMFGADSTRLGLSAGQTEEPTVKKEKDGLTFTVKSTSPIAVAWKNIKEGEQTPPGDDNNQPGGTDNNNQNNQNGQDNNNQNGQDNQNNQNNQNGQDNQNNQGGQNQNNQNGQDNQNNKNNQNNNGNSQNNGSQNGTANNGNTGSDNTKGTNGTNANGTNANGTNADGTKTATSGTSTTAGNDNKGGISSVLPKTGDTASILLWAAGMGIGLLAIIMIIVKKKKK